ncbi:hypothetical protein BKA59DRAFT_526888 [Fusarium tricinctum]|uniref:Uncharacterized protein n=1 Tax=Fusarium tricinctum TaxID=61284 RepID=A0A8K0RXW1_9HYPO|nr:hypothetical protein BKA59DRAFT_526888 [Fusarium tricinctum]
MNKKGEPTQIGGADLRRFVLHSALLRLIDPVRGEPTRYTLDENPDSSLSGSWQLTQKFLDSFALICSTSGSGAKTASAVCLETHGQDGTILRVARNHGLTPEDLAGLKKVLKLLQEVAIKVGYAERLSTQAEPEILQLIVELDRSRILSFAKRIEKRGPEKSQYQAWLYDLHKIARYYSAVKSMVKFAMKEPRIFKEISIQEIKAPKPVPFRLPKEETPLFTAVSKLMNKGTHSTMEQLEKHLGTQDVESQLREACCLSLTLHAEMQLIVFYEGSPERTPRVRLIGTSKKACFLCNEYLRHHPLKLQVSACHQKIYPSWRPPPYYQGPGRFMSAPFNKLLDNIEKLTKRDLKTALGSPRRHMNYDSTAGPSLTLTASVPTELRSLQAAQRRLITQDDASSEDSD